MGFNSGFVFWVVVVANFGGSNCGNEFEFVGSNLEVGLDVV